MNTSPLPAKKLLNFWQAAGYIRAIDRALVETLLRRSPCDSVEILALVALTSAQLGRGHTALNVRALCQHFAAVISSAATFADDAHMAAEFAELLPLDLPQIFAKKSFPAVKKRMEQCDWFCSAAQDDGKAPLVFDGDFLFLRRYFAYEVFVAQRLQALRARRFAILPQAPKILAEIFASLSHEKNSVHWQALAAALSLRSGLTVLTGGPGTGKTTTVVRLLVLLQKLQSEQNAPPLAVALAAPTGKAALRLRESMQKEAEHLPKAWRDLLDLSAGVKTVHKLLGAHPHRDVWAFDAQRPLPLDVLVIDEASMISLEMMAAIVAALPERARLILLGDREQLASVEAGAVLGSLCPDFANLAPHEVSASPEVLDFLNDFARALKSPLLHASYASPQASLPFPADKISDEAAANALDQRADFCLNLRISRRFSDDSAIGQLARAVNRGDFASSEQLFAKATSLRKIQRFAELFNEALPHYQRLQAHISARPNLHEQDDWARAALALYADFQILSAVREGDFGVTGLNARLLEAWRDWIAAPPAVDLRALWFAGRPVMMQKNDYALALMNGDIGMTLPWRDPAAPERESLRVAFLRDDGRLAWVLPTRLTAVETAFAMTVHKSQGSEFGRVALVLPPTWNAILTRELIYTGLTRARTAFVLFAEHGAVWQQALAATMQRSGTLAERLR